MQGRTPFRGIASIDFLPQRILKSNLINPFIQNIRKCFFEYVRLIACQILWNSNNHHCIHFTLSFRRHLSPIDSSHTHTHTHCVSLFYHHQRILCSLTFACVLSLFLFFLPAASKHTASKTFGINVFSRPISLLSCRVLFFSFLATFSCHSPHLLVAWLIYPCFSVFRSSAIGKEPSCCTLILQNICSKLQRVCCIHGHPHNWTLTFVDTCHQNSINISKSAIVFLCP